MHWQIPILVHAMADSNEIVVPLPPGRWSVSAHSVKIAAIGLGVGGMFF
jgi:hypothetical protein